jgi:predicted secreted protein
VEEPEMDEIKLNVNDEGLLMVKIEEGQGLEINLISNPSTGYAWDVVEYNQNILVKEEEYGPLIPKPDEEGSPGEQIFIFRAVGKGQTILRLIYTREVKGIEPASTFSLNVFVQ